MKKFVKTISADIPSAIVVFLIAIPLCLGIAVASGVSPFSGIIAGMVGGIVVGIISKSPLSVSGPAAGLSAIVAAAVVTLPAVEAFFLAVVIAGVFQIIMGISKMGVIGDYIPNSVIKGMLAAIGIILILKQFPYLVGYKTSFEGDDTFIEAGGSNTFSSIIHSLNHLTPIAIAIGIIGLVILFLFESKWIKSKKIFNVLSGPLLVVVIGILINNFLDGLDHKLTRVDAQLVNIPVAQTGREFLSFFKFPDWSYITNGKVLLTAFTLAMVATLETLLGIEAIDKIDPRKRVTPTNRELIAQGTGNMISGFLGGLPLTSVIVRSSANVNSGAHSKMSAILHGVFILLFVYFAPQWLNMIPLAALAAILIFTGYKLAKVSIFKEFYSRGWEQFVPFIVTVLAIVFTDLLKGVLIGIGVAIFFIIRSNFRTAVFSIKDGDHYLIRLRKDVSFFSKPILKRAFLNIPRGSKLVVDITRAEYIDKDVIDTINEFIVTAKNRDINVVVNKSTYNASHKINEAELEQQGYDDMAH